MDEASGRRGLATGMSGAISGLRSGGEGGGAPGPGTTVFTASLPHLACGHSTPQWLKSHECGAESTRRGLSVGKFGEAAAVDLAIGVARQLAAPLEALRDHVVGQGEAQQPPQLGSVREAFAGDIGNDVL